MTVPGKCKKCIIGNNPASAKSGKSIEVRVIFVIGLAFICSPPPFFAIQHCTHVLVLLVMPFGMRHSARLSNKTEIPRKDAGNEEENGEPKERNVRLRVRAILMLAVIAPAVTANTKDSCAGLTMGPMEEFCIK